MLLPRLCIYRELWNACKTPSEVDLDVCPLILVVQCSQPKGQSGKGCGTLSIVIVPISK